MRGMHATGSMVKISTAERSELTFRLLNARIRRRQATTKVWTDHEVGTALAVATATAHAVGTDIAEAAAVTTIVAVDAAQTTIGGTADALEVVTATDNN